MPRFWLLPDNANADFLCMGQFQGPRYVPIATISALIFGQSELEYLLNATAPYRQIPMPVPGDGNLIVITQSGDGVAPVRTVVDATTVAAGQVNPAMAALSAFLEHVLPGQDFVIGDAAVPGTSRGMLVDDSTDLTAGADGLKRFWTDFTSVIAMIEAETGQPVGHLIECWYNKEAALINNFRNAFWPHYFGAYGDGSAFTLGTTHSVTGDRIDHCLWDASAAASDKGRGVFARSKTLWHVLTPMPFLDAPTTTEMGSFSENNARLTEPDRAVMIGLASDTLAQSAGLQVGPSAHLCRFGGASSEIHPDTGSKDGQIMLMWPFAMALMRAAGRTVNEPVVVGIEGPTDGSYADLLVSLPNGGTLTTLSALESRAAYAGTAPHQQPVTGIEITRSGTRHPVYQTAQTGYDAAYRGTVTIQSGSEIHATHGRVGRVRVTPETPFAFGATVSYLRGQATASLLEPRDFDLYPYFLLEHVPDWHDASATYPCPGVAVRPFQEDVQVPVPAPAFTARSAYFDGADALASTTLGLIPGTLGMMSVWIRNADTAWNATTGRYVYQVRVGSTNVFSLITSSSGRMQLRLHNDTATDTIAFYAGPTSATPFVINQWYHVLVGWTATGASIYVNGTLAGTMSFTALDMAGATVAQIGVGAQSTAATPRWLGEIGHLYINLTQTLDFSVQANREKFILSGAPVNLGGNGETPTGTTPQFYCDGAAAAWNNVGTAGSLTVTGDLTAGGVPAM